MNALRTAALGLLASLAPVSAHAAGAFVTGDGSFVGAPTGDGEVASVRALLFQQGDEVTAVLQTAADSGQNVGGAWILPIPGDILLEPVTADPALLDELLRVSDPIYEPIEGCGGSGCGAAVGDTGALAEVRFFDETKASANWTRFGPGAVQSAVASLESSGFTVPTGVVDGLYDHAADGGSFVVMWFTGDRVGTASPALVVRYQATDLVLPQAITAHTAAGEVQTAVLTITDTATGPEGVARTTPKLGIPLYEPNRTPEFYQARVRVALEEAGGDAWVLEYSNQLDTLEPRKHLLVDASILWDETSKVPWSGLNALVRKGMLNDFNPSEVWITRWRTFQKAHHLRDQRFIPDSSVPAYEVYVTADQFGAAAWVWTVPFLLGGWAMRRRRRRD